MSAVNAQEPVSVFKQLSVDNGLLHNYVYQSIQDQIGFLWIAPQYGLNKYDGSKLIHYFHDLTDPRGLGGNEIVGMDMDDKGNIWICTANKVIEKFDPRPEVFSHFKLKGLPFAICADGKGGI